MTRMIRFGLAVVLTLCVPAFAHAATVLIDFGRTGQETVSTAWNNISGADGSAVAPGPFALNDSTGAASGISLGLTSTGTVGHSGVGANFGGPYPAAVSGFPTSANQDSVFLNPGTLTATLSMLNPLGTYSFLFYGAAGNSGAATTWNVTGLNNGSGTIANTLNNSTEVAIVNDIIPNGSNQISILMSSPGIGRWNLLQITETLPLPPAVPEPSTFVLLGLGALGLGWQARRKRRSLPVRELAPADAIWFPSIHKVENRG